MDSKTRAERVKEAAVREGFPHAAIARAGAIDPEDRLGAWLRAGRHADMEWIARTKAVRQDVDERLPGCRSVVVVARPYHRPRPEAAAKAGKVSNYAWGRDYHRVVRKPLRRLAQEIEELGSDVATACCVDSGPVLEKFWAARAGLGWIGRNSLVLRRDLGSYFFLGVVLTTLELEADAPAADYCGACRACVDACPTEAIVDSAVVDSRRCISYHTIENRGDIPQEVADKMDGWVFGCDICQEACPWNRKAPHTAENDFHPRPGHANPQPEDLLKMDEAEFRAEFEGTPILRAKREGMQRNARIALRNLMRNTQDDE
jgi:epoxyqueuosine reductase